jgi:hypothetical protein
MILQFLLTLWWYYKLLVFTLIWFVRFINGLGLWYFTSFGILIATIVLLVYKWGGLDHATGILFWVADQPYIRSLLFSRMFYLFRWLPFLINIIILLYPRILEHLIDFGLLEPCLDLFLKPPQLFLNAPIDISESLLRVIIELLLPPLICEWWYHFLIESLLHFPLHTQLPSLPIVLHLL